MEGGSTFHLGREKEKQRGRHRKKKEKFPGVSRRGDGTRKEKGVEVLGVLFVGRGAGIQGNGLFLIIQTPPTITEEAPIWPHDNFIFTH